MSFQDTFCRAQYAAIREQVALEAMGWVGRGALRVDVSPGDRSVIHEEDEIKLIAHL